MPPRINLPPLTRGLFLVLLCLSALNVSLRSRKWAASTTRKEALTPKNYIYAPELAIPYLVIVPTTSIKFPWTALTAALVENNAVSLAISGLVIWFGGRYLERAWGSKDPTPIQGLLAVEAGFLVALKQLVPEHTVSLFKGALRVRIKHFPAIFVLANMLSGPLLGTDTAFWLSLIGFLVSWIYLRFFRISEISASSSATGGEGVRMKGDASDTFAFVAFFPDAIHPVLAPVCEGVYSTLVQLKLCAPFSDDAIEAGNENAASRSDGLPSIMNGGSRSDEGGGGRRAEAERRRALALKALDQRLNAAAANRATSAPVTATTNADPGISGDTPEAAAGASESAMPVKEAQA
ncbi:hypothetical protein LTR37_016556 [Vermiconidia calcicola]|uniref:Uncharacterized protein n=1 Tax=Vermiconidia calcicola TaxID=1690605 RepID=A0ACC3MMH5_9PEZI|nr:hypothetical protein LTR37_016556 [Vermiconidia calcicola]